MSDLHEMVSALLRERVGALLTELSPELLKRYLATSDIDKRHKLLTAYNSNTTASIVADRKGDIEAAALHKDLADRNSARVNKMSKSRGTAVKRVQLATIQKNETDPKRFFDYENLDDAKFKRKHKMTKTTYEYQLTRGFVQ